MVQDTVNNPPPKEPLDHWTTIAKRDELGGIE